MYFFTGYNFLFDHIHYNHFSDSDHTLLALLDKYDLFMALILTVKVPFYVVTNFLPLSIYHLLFTSLLMCLK